MMQPTIVDIGVFAHNEAAGIAAVLRELAQQDIFTTVGFDVRIVVLANGCRDDTAARAGACIAGLGVQAEVADLAEGGKSRTWNRFVHDLARGDAAVLVFCDADIALPQADALRNLVAGLAQRPALWAINSRPVKDIVHHPEGLSRLDKIIAAAGGTLDDWRSAICGQLYAMPADKARQFHLPIGLPVEDGFLRAMILTDALTQDEDFGRIDGVQAGDVFHIYASERSIGALIRHQTRIVIGSAINAACFARMRDIPAPDRRAELARAAGDAGWLGAVIRARLPRAPFGFVPYHFLFKRLTNLRHQPRSAWRPKRLVLILAGFFFDAIVFANAQIRMMRGTGVGFW